MRSTSHVACTTIAVTFLALSFPFLNVSRPAAAPAGAFDRTGAAQNFAEAFITKLNATGTARAS